MSERNENAVAEGQEPQEMMTTNPPAPTNRFIETIQNGSTRMMSWLFSNEDERKKEDLIRSTQSLYHYVHKYYEISNRLLEILNVQMNQNVSEPVTLNENESILQNCSRVKQFMYQIQEVCKREDKHVQQSLEPALYEKIAFSVASLTEKATVIKELHESSMGVLGNVLCPLVTVPLARIDLETVAPPVDRLKLHPVSAFKVGDLQQSSKKISKLLSESQKRQVSIDEAVDLIRDLHSILKPPCDSYNDILCEVEAYVNIISKKI